MAKKRHATNNHSLKHLSWQRIRSTNLTTKCDKLLFNGLTTKQKKPREIH
ncbi:hypothetical protein [Vibrio gallaecicus]|nr:hypothetical protein [Vibrio gallaecicus]MDN3617406.1 hypothetical protein [Vibrio gallaecicus]